MAIRFRFTSTDDAMLCRFAISPLRETLAAVRMLVHPHRQGYHLPWLRSVAPALERSDLTPLLDVIRRSYSPDFLCPSPASPRPAFADELALVRAADPVLVLAELTLALRPERGGRRPAAAQALCSPTPWQAVTCWPTSSPWSGASCSPPGGHGSRTCWTATSPTGRGR